MKNKNLPAPGPHPFKGIEWEIDGVTILGFFLIVVSCILGVIVGLFSDPKTNNLVGLAWVSIGFYVLGFVMMATTISGPRRRKEGLR